MILVEVLFEAGYPQDAVDWGAGLHFQLSWYIMQYSLHPCDPITRLSICSQGLILTKGRSPFLTAPYCLILRTARVELFITCCTIMNNLPHKAQPRVFRTMIQYARIHIKALDPVIRPTSSGGTRRCIDLLRELSYPVPTTAALTANDPSDGPGLNHVSGWSGGDPSQFLKCQRVAVFHFI